MGISNPTGAAFIPLAALPGDVLETYSDAVVNQANVTYTKKKEIRLARSGSYRIKFDLKASGELHTGYGRVYRNGAAVGTEQSQANITYVNKSEDIVGWTMGDLCQLYIKGGGAVETGYAQNFRVNSVSRMDHEVLT